MLAKLEQIEAALAKAEAALADAVFGSAKIGVDRAEAGANLKKARACCRQLRTVLAELNRSQMTAFRCVDLSCDLLFSPRTGCWVKCLEGTLAVAPHVEDYSHCPYRMSSPPPGQAMPQLAPASPAQQSAPNTASAKQPLLRETVDFLILILAYLEYYYVDVQLQILNLPSIFP